MISIASVGLLAHIAGPGNGPLFAIALFFVGVGAAVGVLVLPRTPATGARKAGKIGMAVVAVGCLASATAFPFLYRSGPSFRRPTSSATLEIVSPRSGEVLRGDPANVPLTLRLDGGTLVAPTTTTTEPNTGHLHVYYDDRLLSVPGLSTNIVALPGVHTLRAEFVAPDHGSFSPPVTSSVTFQVEA